MPHIPYGQASKLRNTTALKDSRHAERIAFTCRVTYTGEIQLRPHIGEGLTKDLSMTGIKIVGNQPVTRGTLLTLTIALPDGQAPLIIFSALVIWVSGVHFSVRFMELSQETRKRIQSFIWKKISKDTVDNKWTRFKIA